MKIQKLRIVTVTYTFGSYDEFLDAIKLNPEEFKERYGDKPKELYNYQYNGSKLRECLERALEEDGQMEKEERTGLNLGKLGDHLDRAQGLMTCLMKADIEELSLYHSNPLDYLMMAIHDEIFQAQEELKK